MTSILKLFSSVAAVMTVAFVVHANGPVQQMDDATPNLDAPASLTGHDTSQDTNLCGVNHCFSDLQCITACGEPAHCVPERGAPQVKDCVID
jgi:hypothetical protein